MADQQKERAPYGSSSMVDYMERAGSLRKRPGSELYWEANDIKRRLHHLIDNPSDANDICRFIDKLLGQAKYKP